MDNGKTFGIYGNEEVRDAEATSDSEGRTVLVRLSSGQAAKIKPPFLILTNKNWSYWIRGVPDNYPGVSYRTSPKSWMDPTYML